MVPKGRATDFDQDDQMDDLAVRLPSLPYRQETIERIMTESIRTEEVARHRPRAQFTFFCGASPEDLAGHSGQLEAVGRCLEWFVFDYVIPELKTTPAAKWLELNRDSLDDTILRDAEGCLNYVLSIFEVAEVNQSDEIAAIDLLREGHIYRINEEIINEELSPGQLLLGRVFPWRGSYVLSGMVAVMDSVATRRMKRLIANDKLKPDRVLDGLDGLELENMIDRSLMSLDKLPDKTIFRRLQLYVESIVPGRIEFEKLKTLIDDAEDPVEIAVRLCRHMHIYSSHEIELVIALVMTTWYRRHKLK